MTAPNSDKRDFIFNIFLKKNGRHFLLIFCDAAADRNLNDSSRQKY